jgi:choice-of-anchor A domain-containing protein
MNQARLLTPTLLCLAVAAAGCGDTQSTMSDKSAPVAGKTTDAPTAALTCDEGYIHVKLDEYNLFLSDFFDTGGGNYTGGHDVLGKVAASGDIVMTDFSVGQGLPATNISNTMVAGGNLVLNRGAVWGDAVYVDGFSGNSSVVFQRGGLSQGTETDPIDFYQRGFELWEMSWALAVKGQNGSVSIEPWGGIMLTGTDPSVNTFQLDASVFDGAVLFSINAPAGSLALVNIYGESATLSDMGTLYSGGIDPSGVLLNFVDVTSVNIQGYGVRGTVLAPLSSFEFNNGSWDGGLFANSLNGNAEGHIYPLSEFCVNPD